MKWLQLRVQLFVDWRANKYETRCVGRRLDAFERMLLGRTVDGDLIILYRITTSYSRVIRQIFLTISWKSKNFPSPSFSNQEILSLCAPIPMQIAEYLRENTCRHECRVWQDFFLLSFFPPFFFLFSSRGAHYLRGKRKRGSSTERANNGAWNEEQTSKISAVCRKIRSGDPFPVPSLEWRLEEARREETTRERERKKAEAEEKKRRVGALDLEKVQFRASGRLRGRGKRIETRRRVERPSDRTDIFTLTPRCLRVTREGVAFWNDSPRFQTFPLAYESASRLLF